MNIVPFAPKLYEAKEFMARTEAGRFTASGTLCGHIDFTGPFKGTFVLSPEEAIEIIQMLQGAITDALDNSDPLHDPRLVG